jgi:YaiO family outer membrane protein
MRAALWPAIAGALLAGSAMAQPAAEAYTSVGLSHERSRLDRGLADWTEDTVRVQRHQSDTSVSELALTGTRRFGLDDTQLELMHEQAIHPGLRAAVMATVSPTHRVLARSSLGGRLQVEVAPAWWVHGGLRHTRYSTTDVDRADLRLEHYIGNFSHSLQWSPVRALGRTEQVVEWRSQWAPERGRSVGLIASAGREATELGQGAVALASVRSVALVARWPLTTDWSLSGSLSRTRQGSFYTRTGLSVGVQRDF